MTNTTIETSMCVKVGVSFHFSERLLTAEKKSRRTAREVLQTFVDNPDKLTVINERAVI